MYTGQENLKPLRLSRDCQPRTNARFIANALLFSGQLSFWHWNIQVHPSSYIFHKFSASLIKASSHRFVGFLLLELLPCFNVFAFQIFKRIFNCIFQEFWMPFTKCWCGEVRALTTVITLRYVLSPMRAKEFFRLPPPCRCGRKRTRSLLFFRRYLNKSCG